MKFKRSYRPCHPLAFDAVAGHQELQRYYRYLSKHYKKLQFVISNTTDSPQEVRLWGANKSIPLTATNRFNNQFNTTQTVTVGNNPQAIVYNPATDLFYIANQLSDNVSVLDADGRIVETIALSETRVPPGTYSPIALAVNDREDSPGFGQVYVVNSIRDSISVIDRDHTLIDELFTGKRPVDIAYNPVDDHFYVISPGEATLFAIDTSTRQPVQRPLEGIPFSVAVDPGTGHIVVNIPESESVFLYGTDHQRLAVFDQIGWPVLTWQYHPLNGLLYGVVEQSPFLLVIDTQAITQSRVPIPQEAVSITYSEAEGLLYIGAGAGGEILRLDQANTFADAFPVAGFETGIALHPINGTVLLCQAAQNSVIVVQMQKAGVTIVENYNEYREEFRSLPALVKHLKIVSSDQLLTNLFLGDQSVTGKRFTRSINISNHNSPRNFLPVAEVFDIDGTLIDGRHQWRFTIQSNQRITLLLYYRQLEVNQLIK